MFRRPLLRLVNAARGRPVTSMVVTGLLGAALAGTAIAASSQSAGPVTAVTVVREGNGTTVNSTDWVNLPGAQTTVTVPAGQRALILARFSATSSCSADQPLVACSVRILIGGVEGAPGGGTSFDTAFGTASDYSESHAIERSRGGFGGLGPGTYTVQVQWKVGNSAATFGLDDWHLTAERSQVG